MWGSSMLPSVGLYAPPASNPYQHYVMPSEEYQSWNGYAEPTNASSVYIQPPPPVDFNSEPPYEPNESYEQNGYSAINEETNWHPTQTSRAPNNNYVKWGDDRKRHDNGLAGNDKRRDNTSRNSVPIVKDKPQQGRHNGKRYLENWGDTMRDDTEVSNRQRKKEMYGMGQAWTREDFFHRLPPTNSPFGVKLLKGMGWKYGQALGKSKEGHTTPVAVDVRFGRQGLCTKEEKEKYFNSTGSKPKPVKKTHPVKNVNGKHPVSLLAEHCMKRQIDMPKYEVEFDYGNIHSKSVLVSVTVGGRTFEPSQPSPYKKHGKALAATLAMKELGFETGI